MLYLQKEEASSHLQPGDCLWAEVRFTPFENDPTFAYRHFMLRRGLSGSAYLPTSQWRRAGKAAPTLTTLTASLRTRLIRNYQRAGLSGDELAVLSALTIGSREELRDELNQAYQTAGVGHLLALSGLHIGLLYGLLLLLFRPLWKRTPRLRIPLLLLLLSLLWLYALLTGSSPSVVRAVLMLTLLTLSNLRHSNPISFDTLLGALFLMLLVAPHWLFEPGFQLSLLSVGAILLLHPRIARRYEPRSRLGRNVWNTLCVTLAAQIGTAPLVLYYFHQLPLHFLWTNLLFVPLTTLILYLGFLFALTLGIPPLLPLVLPLTSHLLQLQHRLLFWVEQLPLTTLKGSITPLQLLLLYLLLALTAALLARPNFRRIALLLGTLCLALLLPELQRHLAYRPGCIEFFHLRETPLIALHSNGHTHLFVPPIGQERGKRAARLLKGHLESRRHLKVVSLATHPEGPGHRYDPTTSLLGVSNWRIALVHDTRRPTASPNAPLEIDFLFLTRHYRGTFQELASRFRIKKAVLDPRLPSPLLRQLRNAFRQEGIPHYELSPEGYCAIMP